MLPVNIQTRADLDAILAAAVANEVSDVHFAGDDPIKVRRHGAIDVFAERCLRTTELQHILISAYEENQSAVSVINSGEDLDFAYTTQHPVAGEYLRFRVNASSRIHYGRHDVTIVFRAINATPPTLSQLGVEPAIAEVMVSLEKGMAMVVGPTGSGKSTLLAALMRERLETRAEVIITHEAPIEYVYDDIDTASVIHQRSIGKGGNYPSFHQALVGSLRQDPDVILVGEARDRETINAALNGVQTGHALFTTVHTTGVAHTINRVIKEFPKNERDAKLMDIIDSISIVVYQNLVPAIESGRIALREYLVFDGEVKTQLRECPPPHIFAKTYQVLIEKGQTLLMDARKKLAENKISEATYRKIKKQFEADIRVTEKGESA